MSFAIAGGAVAGAGFGASLSPAWPLVSRYELASSSPSCARAQPSESEASLEGLSPLLAHPLAPLKLPRLTHAGERRIRSLYCALLQRAAAMLELPALTGVTAAVYWQRFYARSSLLSHAPGLVAAAALFLAAKGDEHGRRVRDVINVIYRCEHTSPHGPLPSSSSNAQGAYHATTPQRIPAYASPMHPASASMPPPGGVSAPSTPAGTGAPPQQPQPPPQPAPPVDDGCSLQVSPLFWELKEEVVRLEQHLLRVLGFGVRVTHPQPYVLHLGRTMEVSAELVRLAYYIANDSARTSLCLQYPPHTVACGCIFVAAELAQEQVRFHPQVLLSAAEQRGTNTTTNTSSNSNINVKAPSPYRSPHHPGAGGGGSGTGGSSSASSSAASYALTPSTHAAEWWEYFGVSQMQLEDCAHQLLELYDEQEEQAHQSSSGGGSWAECNEYEQMMRYSSPLVQLQRIGSEVAAELRREAAQDAARQQRIEDSLKERNNHNTGAGSSSAAATSASAAGTPTRNVAASGSMRD